MEEVLTELRPGWWAGVRHVKGAEEQRTGRGFPAAQPAGKRELGEPKDFSIAVQRPVLSKAQNNV